MSVDYTSKTSASILLTQTTAQHIVNNLNEHDNSVNWLSFVFSHDMFYSFYSTLKYLATNQNV